MVAIYFSFFHPNYNFLKPKDSDWKIHYNSNELDLLFNVAKFWLLGGYMVSTPSYHSALIWSNHQLEVDSFSSRQKPLFKGRFSTRISGVKGRIR
jgi:hypothetical protein